MGRRIYYRHVISVLVVLIILGFAASTNAGSVCILKSFKGKVVDADTKQPIEGAVVMAVYYGSAWSFAGEMIWPVYARETLTDAKGEFKIKSKTIFGSEIFGRPQAKLVILKPSYGAFPEHKRTIAVGENKSWPPSGKHVLYELPKLITFEERRDNVGFMRRYNEIPHDQRKLYWDQVNIERKNVRLPLRTPDEKELK